MTTTALPAMHPADVRVVPEWELCDRLRRSMRLVPGLTNEDVAEIMGVQRPTVSTWLGGRRTPSKAVVMLWADMTGVDRDWLLTGYAIRDSNPEPADSEPWPALRLLPDPRDRRPVTRPRTVKPRLTLIGGAA